MHAEGIRGDGVAQPQAAVLVPASPSVLEEAREADGGLRKADETEAEGDRSFANRIGAPLLSSAAHTPTNTAVNTSASPQSSCQSFPPRPDSMQALLLEPLTDTGKPSSDFQAAPRLPRSTRFHRPGPKTRRAVPSRAEGSQSLSVSSFLTFSTRWIEDRSPTGCGRTPKTL